MRRLYISLKFGENFIFIRCLMSTSNLQNLVEDVRRKVVSYLNSNASYSSVFFVTILITKQSSLHRIQCFIQ